MKTIPSHQIQNISGGRTTFATVISSAITWGILGGLFTPLTYTQGAMVGAGLQLVKMGAEFADDYVFGAEIHSTVISS